MNRSTAGPNFDPATANIRIPDLQTLTSQLLTKGLRICDCDVFEGRYLHLGGFVTFASNLTQYQSALQAAWLAVAPELRCSGCRVDVRFAQPIISVGAAG